MVVDKPRLSNSGRDHRESARLLESSRVDELGILGPQERLQCEPRGQTGTQPDRVAFPGCVRFGGLAQVSVLSNVDGDFYGVTQVGAAAYTSGDFSGLAQIGASEPTKRIITGAVIVVAVVLDTYRSQRASRRT